MSNETPQFWFRSDLFSIEPREDEETNPSRYGKGLAVWVSDRFRSIGYSPEEVKPEDWGWCVMLTRDPFMLWIGCGNVDSDFQESLRPEETSSVPRRDEIVWSCFVGADVPLWKAFFWKRLFGGASTADAINRVAGELEAFLSHESRILLTQEP